MGGDGIMANEIGDYNYNWANIFPGGKPFRTYGEDTSDLSGIAEGITATDAAQEKGWLQNLMDNTMWGKVAGGFDATNPRAFNYNPALQGQIDFMGGDPFGQGSAYGINPNSGLNQITGGTLAGKNLQSMFGTNDLQQMYEDQIGKYEKTYANLDEQWGNTLNEEELEAKKQAYFDKFLNPAKLQHQELLDNMKIQEEKRIQQEKDNIRNLGVTAADVASSSKAFGHMGGGGGWSPAAGQMASGMGGGSQQAKSGSQKAGGSGRTDKGWGWAQGGRVGYKTGGRVGILAAF